MRGVGTSLFLALLAGCGAEPPTLQENEIPDQWQGNLQKLGFPRAVYPPTEEIQVGDIAVFDRRPVDPKMPNDPRPIMRIDRVDVRDALRASYSSRLMLHKVGAISNVRFLPKHDLCVRRIDG